MCENNTFEITRLRYYGLLLAIVLVGVLLRVFHFQLTIGMDDQKWIIAAQELGTDHSGVVFPIHYCRILWRCLLAGWGAMFGLSLGTTAFLMFGLSCLSTLMVAQGARAAFGSAAGLFAAAIYATHPLLVVYDTATLPDGFAIAILASFLCLFLKYLQTARMAYLLSSALLVGLSFSAKEYLVLAALPFGAHLLFKQESQAGKWRIVCLFSAGILAGLAVDFLLHFWESGNALWHVSVLSDYGGTPVAEQAGHAPHGGWERVGRLVVKRLVYLKWLFLDLGFVSGFLVLWGAMFLAFKARTDRACWILIGVILVFSAFLLSAPTRIRPLCLVEMLPYYLTVLLPALAIGSGGALAAAFGSFRTAPLRRSLLVAVVLGLASNVLVPNDLTNPLFRREHMESLVGIRQILKGAPRRSISELILPESAFRVRVPDQYYEYGVKVRLADCESSSAAELAEYLKSDSGCVLYLPRHPISWLMLDVRRGEHEPSGELYQGYRRLANMLAAEDCSVRQVRIPDTVVKSWLAMLGLVKQEQNLVGWLFRFEQTAEHRQSD